jgi:hypothetical protein
LHHGVGRAYPEIREFVGVWSVAPAVLRRLIATIRRCAICVAWLVSVKGRQLSLSSNDANVSLPIELLGRGPLHCFPWLGYHACVIPKNPSAYVR